MKEWVLKLLLGTGILAVVIVAVSIRIYIEGWLSDNEQVDEEKQVEEENPRCLDQSREARASQRRGSGFPWFQVFLLLFIMFGQLWLNWEKLETLLLS